MKDKLAAPKRRLYRRARTMEVLDAPLSMIKKLEDRGLLTKFRLGDRDIFHDAEQVERVASVPIDATAVTVPHPIRSPAVRRQITPATKAVRSKRSK